MVIRGISAPVSFLNVVAQVFWARIVKSINSLNERGIIPFSTLKRKVNDDT
ncbi:hypothetical protein Tco_1341527, partial [Tanacetum coccineum]